jgi:hypothetical protein
MERFGEALEQVDRRAAVPDLDAADRGESDAHAFRELGLGDAETGAPALDGCSHAEPVDGHELILPMR